MSELIHKMLALGIIPEDALAQQRRWGAPVPRPDEVQIPEEPLPLEEASKIAHQALLSRDHSEVRYTTPDILEKYNAEQRAGVLHWKVYVGTPDETDIDVPVTFVVLVSGHYAIPWQDDQLSAVLVDPTAYLELEQGERVSFVDTYETYHGEQQVFIVGIPERTPRIGFRENTPPDLGAQ